MRSVNELSHGLKRKEEDAVMVFILKVRLLEICLNVKSATDSTLIEIFG